MTTYRVRSIDMDGERCEWEVVSAPNPARAAQKLAAAEPLAFIDGVSWLEVEVQELREGEPLEAGRWIARVGVRQRTRHVPRQTWMEPDKPRREGVELEPGPGGVWRIVGEGWGEVVEVWP